MNCMAATYLPPGVMQFALAKKEVGCNLSLINPKNGENEDYIWTSAAVSYNYVSAVHMDDDCFFSALMVIIEETEDDVSYQMDQDITVYFCFPTCGKDIGIRPGDILLFNPLFHHCVSKHTEAYKNKSIYCCSLFEDCSHW